MITGTIRAVNCRPHRTKQGFKEFGLLVNDNWYNLVVPEAREVSFQKGKKIEFDLLEGNTKYINGKSVKYNALNASNDNKPVPSTYLQGGGAKAHHSPVTVSYTGDVDKSLSPVIGRLENLLKYVSALEMKIEKFRDWQEAEIGQLQGKADKLIGLISQDQAVEYTTDVTIRNTPEIDFTDLEEPPFDTEF